MLLDWLSREFAVIGGLLIAIYIVLSLKHPNKTRKVNKRWLLLLLEVFIPTNFQLTFILMTFILIWLMLGYLIPSNSLLELENKNLKKKTVFIINTPKQNPDHKS